jgi:hypothetical protein
MKNVVMTMTLQKDSIVMTRITKRDMLMDNFHSVKITLISCKVLSELCKLHSYDIIMMSLNKIFLAQ